MIKVSHAVELRLYPTKGQQRYFTQVFGCTRKVWNLALTECIDNYKTTGKFQHRGYKDYYKVEKTKLHKLFSRNFYKF